MQNTLLSYIKRRQLFRRGDSVLVAVSGGADSVALLCALDELAASLGISLSVAHLDHRIRGREAEADAEFVRKLALRLGLPFACGHTDVPGLAERKGLSIEMAAREARYDFLTAAARRMKAAVVATAHTADDQAETVLLKLARGAGPRGLAGIARRTTINGLAVVRPLLDVRRDEIERFLRGKKQTWREDGTNRDSAYLRNRVRHEVLPFLEKKLNPDIRRALIRTADLLREEDKWLEELSAGILKRCLKSSSVVPLASIFSPEGRGRREEVREKSSILFLAALGTECIAAKRRVLRLWLSSSGVRPELIDYDVISRLEALLEDAKGTGSMEVAGNWIVKRRYDRLTVEQRYVKSAKGFRHEIKIPGETLIAGRNLRIETSLKPGLVKDRNLYIGRFPARASLRLSTGGKRKIVVRSWRNGDRMKPFGMTGSKKLHHIFIDAKVPVEERGNIPVFECGGEIIWIPGYRVARGWEVSDPSGVSLQIVVSFLSAASIPSTAQS